MEMNSLLQFMDPESEKTRLLNNSGNVQIQIDQNKGTGKLI